MYPWRVFCALIIIVPSDEIWLGEDWGAMWSLCESALKLKLRKVSRDLLHIRAVRRVQCCNDFIIHPQWECLNKFQELLSWHWTDLKWAHRRINTVDQLSAVSSICHILPLDQREGCFLPPALLVLQLAEHLGAVPHGAMTLWKWSG